MIARFEQDVILFNDTSTAGAIVFVPGANAVFVNSPVATLDSTAFNFIPQGYSPGINFLVGSASSIRCVASCLQFTYPGTEFNRSGIVSGGVTSFSTFAANVSTAQGGGNVTTTVGQVRTTCQHTERTPQNMMEILWMPGPGDQDWYELGSAQGAAATIDDISDKNAIVATVSGIPASTGIRMRLVSVLEWLPRSNQGLVSTVEVPRSANSINDVLRALPAKGGHDWFINAYRRPRHG
jgi:hypothetical protein